MTDRKRVGVVVNPFAGAGGRLGWKGTDWPLPLEVARRGVPLVAPFRARRFARTLEALMPSGVEILAPPGPMGSGSLSPTGLRLVEVDCVSGEKWPTEPSDTLRCLRMIAGEADLVVFVGGDGTARLAVEAFGESKPSLGVPAGVKVYSAVFAYTPEEAARLTRDYLEGRLSTAPREVLDIDEDEYRRGRLVIRLYGYLRVPVGPGLVAGGKQVFHGASEEEAAEEIAEYFAEELYRECHLYILGPGRTVEHIARRLGVEKTPLGVDLVHNRRLIARDADEEAIYEAVKRYHPRVYLIVSPLGGQGFLLGRGNQQISPRIIRMIGRDRIIVVATPGKLKTLKTLRVDTGDPQVDGMLQGYIRVLTGYARYRLVRVA